VLSISLPFGCLTALFLERAVTQPAGLAGRILRRMTLVLAFLAAAALVALFLFAPQTHWSPWPLPKVDLTPFRFAFVPVLSLALSVLILSFWAWLRRRPAVATIAFGLLPVLLVVLGSGIFSVIYERRSARAMAAQIPTLPANTELAFYRSMPNGLPFYLRRTGTLITTDGGELSSNYVKFALRKSTEWPAGLVEFQNFDRWINSRRTPVYLMARDTDEAWLKELAARRGATVQNLPQRYFGVLLPPQEGS
jgi:hypothetical protein